MSHLMTKAAKWHVRPAKTQISLGICQSDQSLLCAQWVAKDPSFLNVDSEDSDQTGRMPRLIWVFAGCTVILLVLSWGGSYSCVYCSSYPWQKNSLTWTVGRKWHQYRLYVTMPKIQPSSFSTTMSKFRASPSHRFDSLFLMATAWLSGIFLPDCIWHILLPDQLFTKKILTWLLVVGI